MFWEGIKLLKIYKEEDRKLWNECVKSFENWDIYYLNEYLYSFKLHGDGDPLLIYYEDNNCRFCYGVMKNDISKLEVFKNSIKDGIYYDLETPYGYGGPLSDTEIPIHSQQVFLKELTEYCIENKIISQFIRFHPLLSNYKLLPEVIETRYLRDTIFIDTETKGVIMSNMDKKNRNMIRKAQNNGIEIVIKEISDYEDFIKIYDETMKNNNAEEYYTFKKNYFESLSMLKEYSLILYAMLDEKPISSSIMFFNDQYMHYHLSGTLTDYRKYSAGNLLLYEAACYANSKGIKKFHLGGGMNPEDSLYSFKKKFNKYGKLPFVVGRTIFDKKGYDALVNLRKELDSNFNDKNNFMIQYRK